MNIFKRTSSKQRTPEQARPFRGSNGTHPMPGANRTILNYLILALAAVAIAAYSVTVYSYVRAQINDNLRLNMAARQRMITQKITKNLLLFRDGLASAGQVRHDLELFDASLHAITHGGPIPRGLDGTKDVHLDPVDDRATRNLLHLTIRKWRPFRQHALHYLDARDRHSLDHVLGSNEMLLSDIDRSVTLIQRHADGGMAVLFILVSGAITFIAGMVIIAFIWQKRRILDAKRRIADIERLLPLCANCKKIRNADGDAGDPLSWTSIDDYLTKNRGMVFTHSLCPDCVRKLYPDMDPDEKK